MRIFTERIRLSGEFRVALLAYVVAVTIQSGHLNGDTQQRQQVAHSLWAGGEQVLPKWQEKYAIPGKNGQPCAWYGIGQSLVIIPFDWVGTVAAQRLHLSGSRADTVRDLALNYGLFPLIAALSVLTAVRILTELGFDQRESLAGGLGLLLGSSFLAYTNDHQENSLIFLVEAVGLLRLLRFAKRGRATDLIIGTLALGYTLTMRLPLLLDVVAISALVLLLVKMDSVEEGEESQGKFLGRAAAIVAVSIVVYGAYLALDRAYQYHRFGSIWSNYIQLFGDRERRRDPSLSASYPFSGSFTKGMSGPFIDPAKSVFLFDPLMSLGLVAVALRWRKDRKLDTWMATFALVLVGQAFFHARLVFWGGDHAWGDRYVLTPVWMMSVVGSALLYRIYRGASRPIRAVILGVTVLSISIQIASVVLNCSLEVWQRECTGGPSFVIGQRFVNLGRYFFGSSPAMVAGCNAESQSWIAFHFRPNFTPFQFQNILPRGAFILVKTVWFGLVLCCLVLTWSCVSLLTTPNREQEEIKVKGTSRMALR